MSANRSGMGCQRILAATAIPCPEGAGFYFKKQKNMKNILFLISVLASPIGLFAQTFITSNNASGDTSRVNGTGTLTAYNNLKATGNPVAVKWRVLDYSPNLTIAGTEWSLDGICDNITCYTGGPLLAGSSYKTDPYGSTSFGVFYALLGATNAPVGSTAWLRVSVSDTTIGGTFRTLTFIGTKNTSGVVQMAAGDDIQLFPNPAGANVVVSTGSREDVRSLVIYAADGRRVASQAVVGKVSTVSLDKLVAGQYFLSVLDAGGQVIAKRTFMHQ